MYQVWAKNNPEPEDNTELSLQLKVPQKETWQKLHHQWIKFESAIVFET